MGAQFDAASDRVSRTSAPNPASGITFTAWFRIDVDRDDFSTLMRLHASGGGSTTLTIGTGSGGVVMQVFSAGGTVTSAPAVVGDWYRVAYTITGTSVALYLADETGATAVFTGTVTPGATPDGLTIGGRSVGDSDEPFAGTLGHARLWTGTVSTQADIEAEWASATPVRTSGLWADWPLDEDLLDASGNGRHLTAGTTAVTFVEGPPLPAGDFELPLDPAAETDTAVPLGAAKSRQLAPAPTVETAMPFGRHKALALTSAIDVESAQLFLRGKGRVVSTAVEAETAAALGAAKTRALSTATETDTAQPLGGPALTFDWPPQTGLPDVVASVAVGPPERVDLVHVGTP